MLTASCVIDICAFKLGDFRPRLLGFVLCFWVLASSWRIWIGASEVELFGFCGQIARSSAIEFGLTHILSCCFIVKGRYYVECGVLASEFLNLLWLCWVLVFLIVVTSCLVFLLISKACLKIRVNPLRKFGNDPVNQKMVGNTLSLLMLNVCMTLCWLTKVFL